MQKSDVLATIPVRSGIDGELAYQSGRWTLTNESGTTKGSHTFIFKRGPNNEWKIVSMQIEDDQVKAQADGRTSARQAIAKVNEQFMQAWKAGNAAAVAALYTDDAVFLAPHAKPVIGREAITKYVQGALNAGLKEIKLETAEFNRFGNIAHERGQYKLLAGNGQVVDNGKYMIIWKQQDGDWKIHWDMYNTSRPMPTPPKN